jgi:hypothetical protein
LLRIGFLHHQQIIEQRQNGPHQDALLVCSRALLVRAKEKRALVWEGRRKLYDLGFTVAQVHHGGRG